MAIDYDHIMSLKSEPVDITYTDRETMLYALGVGFGRDPMNEAELPFVYEKDLRAVPSMATVLTFGSGGMLMTSGINFMLLLHGEQRLTFNKPLPATGTITVEGRVVGAYDKGEGKGALVLTETDMIEKETGEKIGTLGMTAFCRGDGGFGGPSEGAPEPHVLPERDPDGSFEVDTRPDQALLYRLSGDRNPLHSDPEFAKMAGYDQPILHGLCTYGSVCRGVITNLLDYDPAKLKTYNVRFASPVMPGQTIVTEYWKDGNTISLRSSVKETGKVVMNNGLVELAD